MSGYGTIDSCRPRARAGTRKPDTAWWALRSGVLALMRLSAFSLLLAATPNGARADDAAKHPGGFWKCRPGGLVKGEFDSEDPVGLAARSHVATNCEYHWSDGHGATYCFATPPSFLEFENNPDILPKARAFWRLEHPGK